MSLNDVGISRNWPLGALIGLSATILSCIWEMTDDRVAEMVEEEGVVPRNLRIMKVLGSSPIHSGI